MKAVCFTIMLGCFMIGAMAWADNYTVIPMGDFDNVSGPEGYRGVGMQAGEFYFYSDSTGKSYTTQELGDYILTFGSGGYSQLEHKSGGIIYSLDNHRQRTFSQDLGDLDLTIGQGRIIGKGQQIGDYYYYQNPTQDSSLSRTLEAAKVRQEFHSPLDKSISPPDFLSPRPMSSPELEAHSVVHRDALDAQVSSGFRSVVHGDDMREHYNLTLTPSVAAEFERRNPSEDESADDLDHPKERRLPFLNSMRSREAQNKSQFPLTPQEKQKNAQLLRETLQTRQAARQTGISLSGHRAAWQSHRQGSGNGIFNEVNASEHPQEKDFNQEVESALPQGGTEDSSTEVSRMEVEQSSEDAQMQRIVDVLDSIVDGK